MTAQVEKMFDVLAGGAMTLRDDFPTAPQVETEWISITGAPGAGKTTILNQLSARGCVVVEESSRRALCDAISSGFTLEEVRAQPDRLARAVLVRKLRIANALDAAVTIVWDTGLVDALVFARLSNIASPSLEAAALRFRFKTIISLAPLQHHLVCNDPLRPQSERERNELGHCLITAYRDLGYCVLSVEAASPAERFAMVDAAIRGESGNNFAVRSEDSAQPPNSQK